MREFRTYDAMMEDFYRDASNFLLPLNTWEFYGEYMNNLNLYKEDLATLSKLSTKWNFEANYYDELIQKNRVIVVTNPSLKIVYATHNIEKMNGFTPEEVIGNSPKMFQGMETCKDTTKRVREAITKEIPFEVSILNYRKDKTVYYCNIKGFPVRDQKGKLVNYIAFEEAA